MAKLGDSSCETASFGTFDDFDVTDYIETVCTYICKLCKFTSVNPQDVRAHIVTVHFERVDYTDGNVGKSCSDQLQIVDGADLATSHSQTPCVATMLLNGCGFDDCGDDANQNCKIGFGGERTTVMGADIVNGRGRVQKMLCREGNNESRELLVQIADDPREVRLTIPSSIRRTCQRTNEWSRSQSVADSVIDSSMHVSFVREERQQPYENAECKEENDAGLAGEPEYPIVGRTATTSVTAEELLALQNGGNESVADVREFFICGKCSTGYSSMAECKLHMIQEHGVEAAEDDDACGGLPPNMASVGTQAQMYKKPGRKRKMVAAPSMNAPRDYSSRGKPPSLANRQAEANPEDGGEDSLRRAAEVKNAMSVLGIARSDDPNDGDAVRKRRVRPPKSLTEDYYISRRKHKKRVIVQSSDEKFPPPTTAEFACSMFGCSVRLSNMKSVELHVSCHATATTEHPLPPISYACPFCDTRCGKWNVMRLHLWRVHDNDVDLLRCSACQFRTDTAPKLAVHLKTHSSVLAHCCSLCGKGFKKLPQLRNHEFIHHFDVMDGKEGHKRSYSGKECWICKRTFTTPKCLRKHVEVLCQA